MAQESLFSIFYMLILFLNSFLLFVGFARSYSSISRLNIAAFNHFSRSWICLAYFWFGFILLELVIPLYEMEIGVLFNYITFFIAPFMIEIFNFYLALFSNRLNQFEKYFPILIGITWGLSFGALLTMDPILLILPLGFVLIISLFFLIYCLVIFIRLQKITNTFLQDNQTEMKFINIIKVIILFTIIAGSYDAIWIPLGLLFPSFFYILSTIGFIILILLTLIFLLKVIEMIKILPEINISLIINELN